MGSIPIDPQGPTRIVVTGASGFIGDRVVAKLEGAGHDVVAIGHPRDSNAQEKNDKRLSIDLVASAELAQVLAGARYVVHLAARSGGVTVQTREPLETFVHNIQVTANVLRASAAAGVKRLFLASSAVVYRPLKRHISETDPTLGLADGPSGYAWSKICDEVQVGWKAKDLDVVVGRFTNVYGTGGGGRSTVIHDLVDRALAAAPDGILTVWGRGDVVRSFINVEDAARAVVLVTTRGERGHTYNIDSGEGVTIGDLAAIVRDLVSPSIQIRFDPTRPTGDPYRVLNPERLNSLGFQPQVALKDGLSEVVSVTKPRAVKGSLDSNESRI
ncbi:MAG: NAD(P)-dependent oxidoreductase [Acidimicrobiia bacterium]